MCSWCSVDNSIGPSDTISIYILFHIFQKQENILPGLKAMSQPTYDS